MTFKLIFGWALVASFVNIPTTSSKLSEHIHDPRKTKCSKNGSITVVVIDNPPYVIVKNGSEDGKMIKGAIMDFFMSAISTCYQECNVTLEVADNVNELLGAIHNNKANIAFPVTSSMAINLTWPWHKGGPIILHAAMMGKSRAVIIHKEHYNTWVKKMMLNSLFKAWPLFVFTFLLAGFSGLCIWILESHANDDFTKSFSKGWFEGFWWAFVSMTTVGYGDKTPKTVLGRIFGSVWIVFGLVIVAMFTATATNAMTTFEHGIAQARVAVLSSTDASLQASRNGATAKKFKSFDAMVQAIHDNQVDAILVDQYVGAFFVEKLADDKLRMLSSLGTDFALSIAFLDDLAQHIHSDCFRDIEKVYGTSHFLEKYTKLLKVFDYSSDFVGLFSSDDDTAITMLITAAVLTLIIMTGTVLEKLNKKYKIPSRGWCKKCHKNTSTETKVEEINNNRLMFSNETRGYPMEEMHTRIYPRPMELKTNPDSNLQNLTEEVQRLRIIMNQILERLNSN